LIKSFYLQADNDGVGAGFATNSFLFCSLFFLVIYVQFAESSKDSKGSSRFCRLRVLLSCLYHISVIDKILMLISI